MRDNATMSTTVTIDLEDEVRRALDRLARETNRSVDDHVTQAVRDYLEVQKCQYRKIEAGVAAADRGDFAS
ncbi:MAG: CopG family ribbon-helix-helix protein, partial [Terriglobia bacterium]